MRKVLGILGGMGPFATAQFFVDLLKATDAKKDWDHLRVIIDNNVDIPSRTRSLLYGEKSPVDGMRNACFNLMAAGCDYIAVPCNSAHYFYSEVVDGTTIPWINMIELVSKNLKKYRSVLILGGYCTVVGKIYDNYLDNTLYLEDNSIVYEIIEDAKLDIVDKSKLNNLYCKISDYSVDAVLMGCTELPIVMTNKINDVNFVNCNEIYIKELISICGGVVKREICR